MATFRVIDADSHEDRIMISADMPHGEARKGSVEEIQERTDLNQPVK